MIKTSILIVMFSVFYSLHAQEARNVIREGNKSYSKGDMANAESKYKAAIEKNPQSFEANFNLGDVYYNFENYDEATQYFNKAQNLTDDKLLKAKALHNLGNTHFKKEEYKESVEAFKQALKNNPKDEETRRNLSLAMKYLKEQEQSNCENPDKNKDDKKDENKEDKNQDKDEKGDENKEQENKDQENKDSDNKNEDGKQNEEQQEQQQQEQESKLSKEDAQRILDAMNNEEKNTRDKLMKQQMKKGQPVKIEKDW